MTPTTPLAVSERTIRTTTSRHWWKPQADLVLMMAALVAAAFIYPSLTLNHDKRWYLVAPGLCRDGAKLYQDVMEINPPLAFYLTAAPLFLADLFGLSEKTAFCVTLVVMTGVSLYWVRSLLLRAPDLTREQRRALLAGFGLALIVVPIGNFGQREHIMMVLSAPYPTPLS